MGRILPMAVLLLSARLWGDISHPPPPPDQDPFVGTWVRNNTKSVPQTSGKYRLTITRKGEYFFYLAYNDQASSKNWIYRLKCDGSVYTTRGVGISCEYNSPRSVVGVSVDPWGGRLYVTREISRDNNEMTIVYFENNQRTKVSYVTVLDRVK